VSGPGAVGREAEAKPGGRGAWRQSGEGGGEVEAEPGGRDAGGSRRA
jgi:hypothetical protein